MTEKKDEKKNTPKTKTKSTSGIEPSVATLIAYLLSIVGAIVLLIIEKDNEVIKFHAWQSLLLSIATIVAVTILTVTLIGALLVPFVGLAAMGASVYAIIKAFNDETWEMPVIGKEARKLSKK